MRVPRLHAERHQLPRQHSIHSGGVDSPVRIYDFYAPHLLTILQIFRIQEITPTLISSCTLDLHRNFKLPGGQIQEFLDHLCADHAHPSLQRFLDQRQ